MNVIAYDPFPDENYAERSRVFLCEFGGFIEKNSDAISIHVPYMRKTHHLINKSNIGLIKKGVYSINTARGGIVETDALVKSSGIGNFGGRGTGCS